MMFTSQISELLLQLVFGLLGILVVVPLCSLLAQDLRDAFRRRNPEDAAEAERHSPEIAAEPGRQQPMQNMQMSWPPRRSRRAQGRNRRRFMRVGTTIRGYIAQNYRLAECEILDMSLGGARVRADETLGDQAHLTLGFGRFGLIAGEVVWRRKGVMGIKYVDAPKVVEKTLSGLLPQHCLAS